MYRSPLALTRLIASIAAICLFMFSLTSEGQQRTAKSSAPPLKLEHISDMVASGLNSVDILVEAKSRGLAFVLSADVIKELEEQGADPLLLNWLGMYSVELQKLYATALSELRERRYGRVVELCSDLLHRSPRLLPIYLIRGAAFRAQNQFDKAADDFRQALKFHPNSSRARVLLAESLIERKQTDEAIQQLHWVTEHRSAASIVDWPTAHRLLAAAYLQRRDYQLASQELHTALWQSPLPDAEATGLLPQLENPMSELARLLALCPDTAIAAPGASLELATLMKLLATTPAQQQTALLRLAEANAALGKFEDAVDAQKSAALIKSDVDTTSFTDRLALYQKKQRPLLLAGTPTTARPETLMGEITPASLLAKMKRIEPDASPSPHGAKAPKPFLIGTYEVTVSEWASVMGQAALVGPDLPVDRVSWDECHSFLNKLNERAGSAGPHFRLPTAAEYRRVSQHPKLTSNGEPWQLSQEAWYARSGGQAVHRVGLLSENAAGLHDVFGNVAEWCADDVSATVKNTPKPSGPAFRIVWGGSYLSSDTQCLSSTGALFKQNEARRGLGLRLAADIGTTGTEPSPPAVPKADSRLVRAGIDRAIDAARSALEREAFQRGWLRDKLFTLIYLQACVRAHLDDVDAAVLNLRSLIREMPEEGALLMQLARCHLAWIQATRPSPTPDQLAEAHKIVEVALTHSEFRLWVAYLSQSAVLMADGKLDDAIRRANQAHDLAPPQFKDLCMAQKESLRARKKAISSQFPVPPAYAHGVTPHE